MPVCGQDEDGQGVDGLLAPPLAAALSVLDLLTFSMCPLRETKDAMAVKNHGLCSIAFDVLIFCTMAS